MNQNPNLVKEFQTQVEHDHLDHEEDFSHQSIQNLFQNLQDPSLDPIEYFENIHTFNDLRHRSKNYKINKMKMLPKRLGRGISRQAEKEAIVIGEEPMDRYFAVFRRSS